MKQCRVDKQRCFLCVVLWGRLHSVSAWLYFHGLTMYFTKWCLLSLFTMFTQHVSLKKLIFPTVNESETRVQHPDVIMPTPTLWHKFVLTWPRQHWCSVFVSEFWVLMHPQEIFFHSCRENFQEVSVKTVYKWVLQSVYRCQTAVQCHWASRMKGFITRCYCYYYYYYIWNDMRIY